MSSGANRIAPDAVDANAAALDAEFGWLEAVLKERITSAFGDSSTANSMLAIPPALDLASALGQLVARLRLDVSERLVLALALAPHLRPQLLDPLLLRNPATDRGFTEFGGRKGSAHTGFLPTGETAALLVAGNDLSLRTKLRRLFDPGHIFTREALVRIDHDAAGEPVLSGMLTMTDDTVSLLTAGIRPKPDFSNGFPAHRLTTQLGWDDLVLGDEVRADIETIRGWIVHGETIMTEWDMGRVLKPGYRSLFYGPPGTGKTLTATLIGQACNKDVYRIDLSMMVSKYIGETEKNLSRVFDRAEHGEWILFFDEADALFGKRTATSSSNDRHANQEVSYLLQRVEDFPGHVILATNLKGNIDDAFARRFQSMVHFPMPDARQRLALWRGILRSAERIDDDVSLPELAERHELSGGAIANIVRFAAINALSAERSALSAADLRLGIVKELRKEGRTL